MGTPESNEGGKRDRKLILDLEVTGHKKYRYIYTYDKAVRNIRSRFIKKKSEI